MSDFAAGQLPTDPPAELVDHVAACRRCGTFVDSFTAGDRTLRMLRAANFAFPLTEADTLRAVELTSGIRRGVAVPPPRRFGWRIAAAVAAAAVAACAGWLLSRPAKDPAPAAAVAGGEWAEGAGPAAGSARPGETLRLVGGRADLTFTCGAKVVVCAPAELVTTSGRECRLLAGRLNAVVGPTPGEFSVSAGAATVTPLGADVSVELATGGVEIHACLGAAEVRGPSGESLLLGASEAACLPAGEASLTWATFDRYRGLSPSEAPLPELRAAEAVEWLDRPPVSLDPTTPGLAGRVVVFLEKDAVVLSRDVKVDIARPGTYRIPTTAEDAGVVPAGTRVRSYLLQATRVHSAAGRVTFDQPVLGLIVVGQTLRDTQAVLGGRPAPPHPSVGLEPADEVTLDPDGRTVRFRLTVDTFADRIRVVVDPGAD